MDHIFIVAENFNRAHAYAEMLGFKRGQYRTVIQDYHHMRGLREATLFVMPQSELNPHYNEICCQALASGFTVIFIEDETLDIIDGLAYTEATIH